MEKSELMLGNILQDKVSKTFLKVIELTEKDVVTYVIDRSKFPLPAGWGLEPVKLNDEIFIQLGFKKINAFLYQLDVFEIGLNEDDFFKGQFTVRINKSLKMTVKYIHEIQNICTVFAGLKITLS